MKMQSKKIHFFPELKLNAERHIIPISHYEDGLAHLSNGLVLKEMGDGRACCKDKTYWRVSMGYGDRPEDVEEFDVLGYIEDDFLI